MSDFSDEFILNVEALDTTRIYLVNELALVGNGNYLTVETLF